MRNSLTPQTRWIDLTNDDLRAIIESVEPFTAFWRVKATGAPSPQSRSGGTRWAYLFWAGPPSENVVPSVAITRHRKGYRITILDPLELFASGAFEAIDCGDLASLVELVLGLVGEFHDIALDRDTRDMTTVASCLVTRERGSELSKQIAERQEFILDSMAIDTMH